MSSLTSVPTDVIRLPELLAANEGLAPILDIEHPSIEVWVMEEGDQLRRWILVAIGERTVTVMNPSNERDRVLRKHQRVWIGANALTWRKENDRGYRRQVKATWTVAQGQRGRERALASRKSQPTTGGAIQ